MKRFVQFAAVGLLAASVSSAAYAQDTTSTMTGDTTMTTTTTTTTTSTGSTSEDMASEGGGMLLKAPVFLFMPGGVTANVISAPDNAGDAISGVNVRFMTLIPTASPWFSLVAGVQFQPNGLGGSGQNNPGFFYGGVIPFLPASLTGGWFSASIDPLGVYGPNPRFSGRKYPYSHEFYLEGAVVVNLGAKMFGTMGAPFNALGAYFLIDQALTHVGLDENGDEDYFNPVLLYGLIIPIAPWAR